MERHAFLALLDFFLMEYAASLLVTGSSPRQMGQASCHALTVQQVPEDIAACAHLDQWPLTTRQRVDRVNDSDTILVVRAA
jgi:hypothetical protein